jgi:hypothetical protein
MVHSSPLTLEIKTIEKNNKKLRNAIPLISNRVTFEKVRSFWAEKRGTWCAIDFEGWEMEHTLITEVGWSYVRWLGGMKEDTQVHLIVEEYQGYINGKYVPENRKVGDLHNLVMTRPHQLTNRITTSVRASTFVRCK